MNLALLVVGALVLVTSLGADTLRRSPVSVPLLGLATGVALGPAGAGAIAITEWGDPTTILAQAARLSLAIGLIGVALRLPAGYMHKEWSALAVLLGLGMPLTWLVGGLLAHLILGLPWWPALLIGAIATPTDPVVASTLTTGALAQRCLPPRLRQILAAESGLNDGLAYALVFLPLLLLSNAPSAALRHWLVQVILWEVGVAALAGMLLGYGAGQLLGWAQTRGAVTQPALLAYALALALTVLGAVRVLHSDGVLAVFVAGLAYTTASPPSSRARQLAVQEAIERFFTLPAFVLLGLALPWAAWWRLGWGGLLFAAALLLLRRLPVLLLLHPLIAPLRQPAAAGFAGWFGPIGISALYYASLAEQQGRPEAWVIGSLLIGASVLGHGMTAAPLTRWYGRRRVACDAPRDEA